MIQTKREFQNTEAVLGPDLGAVTDRAGRLADAIGDHMDAVEHTLDLVRMNQSALQATGIDAQRRPFVLGVVYALHRRFVSDDAGVTPSYGITTLTDALDQARQELRPEEVGALEAWVVTEQAHLAELATRLGREIRRLGSITATRKQLVERWLQNREGLEELKVWTQENLEDDDADSTKYELLANGLEEVVRRRLESSGISALAVDYVRLVEEVMARLNGAAFGNVDQWQEATARKLLKERAEEYTRRAEGAKEEARILRQTAVDPGKLESLLAILQDEVNRRRDHADDEEARRKVQHLDSMIAELLNELKLIRAEIEKRSPFVKQDGDKQDGDKRDGDKRDGDKQDGDKQDGDKRDGDKQDRDA